MFQDRRSSMQALTRRHSPLDIVRNSVTRVRSSLFAMSGLKTAVNPDAPPGEEGSVAATRGGDLSEKIALEFRTGANEELSNNRLDERIIRWSVVVRDVMNGASA